MAIYRIVDNGGVYDTVGLVTITTQDTDAWADYQTWLSAGNVPDSSTGLPTNPTTFDTSSINDDGVDELTMGSVPNPSTVTVYNPQDVGVEYATQVTCTDGVVYYTSTVPGSYSIRVQSAGYADATHSFSVV